VLIGFNMPAVQSVALVGGTWLTADAGEALFDGKPARRSRINRTGALSINITLADAVVPGIIAVLGLNVPAGVTVKAAGATGQTYRLPDGSVCAWLFPNGAAAVSSIEVEIATAVTNVEIGEIAIFRAVDVGIGDGWNVSRIDTTAYTRTKGGQLNSVPGQSYRRFTANLSARPTEQVWNGGLAGMDWEAVVVALMGGKRGCIVPQYSQSKGGALDPGLAVRSAIYGSHSNAWATDNVSGRHFSGYLEFEEVPA
jgi:hypothetical protein